MPHPDCECQRKLNIAKALLKAQEDFDSIEADGTNPAFKSKYARLVGLYNATKKALRKNDILVNHSCDTHHANHQQLSKTILTHTLSGETLEDVRYLLPEKPGSQGHGSAETYMKRYALKSLLGTDVGEDDDDGEAERTYIERVNKLGAFIKTKENPKELYQALLNHFNISHIKQLGDAGLFEALLFISKQNQ